jgi:tetratricopeptide (TPR) repeat protein
MDNELLLKQVLTDLMKEDDGVTINSPIPIDQQLQRKRLQYMKMLELTSFKERIQKAVETVQDQMQRLLPDEEYSALIAELAQAADLLVESPEKQGKELGLSQKTLDLLVSLAETKLKEGVFEEAASLFTLLTVLDRSWYRYWLFLGVALQELKEYNEAIQAYKTATEITEEDPLAHLFSAECYCNLSDLQNTQLHLDKAKVIMQGLPPNAEWERLVAELEAKK